MSMSTIRTRSLLLVVMLTLLLVVPQALAQTGGDAQPSAEEQQAKLKKAAGEVLRKLNAWQPKDARSLLEPLYEDGKKLPIFKTARALLLAEEGKLEEAMTLFAEAAAADPKDPAAKYYLGEVHYWQKQNEKAEAAWKDALERARAWVEKHPDDGYGLYYLGAALIRNRHFADAREPLKKAIKNDFDPAMARYQIGLSHAFAGSWEAAKTSFSEVIERDEAFAHAYFFRGLAWDKLKRKDNMLLDMDKFVKLAESAPEASKAKSLLSAARR